MEAIKDGVNNTNIALDLVGLTIDGYEYDIPGMIKYVADMTQASSQGYNTPVRDEVQVLSKVCEFAERGEAAQYVCKCGCRQLSQ